MTKQLLNLPLLSPKPATEEAPRWEGLVLAEPLPGWTPASDSPEPDAPQGAYSAAIDLAPAAAPTVVGDVSRRVELLAPAGGPDCAFAAFDYGADAIYLGLKKFSARAEAENFTLEELDEVVAFAHSLTPRRRVFVTINTLIQHAELPGFVETLAALDEMGVDAIILQDLGVYHVARRHFPRLELHGSTQMAVHNRAGAEAIKQLGFQRVVLARELTIEEVSDVTATAGVETEVFIHGALCYSYSGLCLFSSQNLGRSGNRGKCAYSCRDSYEVTGAPETLRDGTPTKRDASEGFPFSMKDLALPDFIPSLKAAGVSCFKIEGRKKSPLYVATTTGYYRNLLDGTFTDQDKGYHESDMKAVFSRPWTQLFVQSHKDKEVADRDTVGHRGTPIGKVESIRHAGPNDDRLRFRTRIALAKHDGIQIDLPILGKPYGFGIGDMWLIDRPHRPGREAFEVESGSLIEVKLPPHHPRIPVSAPVYCSASQAVKRRYDFERPKLGLYRVRRPVEIDAVLTPETLTLTARIKPTVAVTRTLSGPFSAARDVAAMETAARGSFEKLGDTTLELAGFIWHNPDGLFIPVSKLNSLRRELAAAVEEALGAVSAARVTSILADVCPANRGSAGSATLSQPFGWSVKVDRIGFLDAFEAEDWIDVEEVIVDVTRDHPTTLTEKLDHLSHTVGRDHIRLALPPLTRKWEEKGVLHKLDRLRSAGWTKWEAANLSAWSYLGLDPARAETSGLDLATDWSVYCVNREAARQLLDMGVTRFALSPEDGLPNMRPLLAEFGRQAVVIVYQDTPLFLAESCAYANLIGGCPGKANCSFESMEMVSSHGERVTALDYHCRTIVLSQGPFCLSRRLDDLAAAGAVSLRADFIYRKYEPTQVRDAWRLVRAGQPVPGGHAANFDRGML